MNDDGNPLDSYSTEAKANMKGRQSRMRSLLRHIDTNGQYIPQTKLIALYCVKEGISKSTTYGYLEEYLECEIVVQYGEHIMIKDQYDKLKAKDDDRLRELAEVEQA